MYNIWDKVMVHNLYDDNWVEGKIENTSTSTQKYLVTFFSDGGSQIRATLWVSEDFIRPRV